MEIALMIEGQDGLTWERWQRIGRFAEERGFAGLYRSDHYTNANPPDKDSLELWTSLTWLASHTERIEFGPLVSPVSFREPTMTARIASAVDDLSGGRLTLGLGAGWQEREHTNFGHALLEIPERFDRFEEGLEVISKLLYSDEPSDFDGDYYELNDAILLPRPQRRIPILIGGNGPKRTLPLTAKYADEWNSIYLTPDALRKRNARLDQLLEEEGREPSDVKRSMMCGVRMGRTEAELNAQLRSDMSVDDYRERGVIVGLVDEIGPQIEALEAAGVQRLMLQWFGLDDMDGLNALTDVVLG